MTKRETLDALKTECFADLAEFVVFGQCVFGQGNENSPLALVGEAPGRFEVEQGLPFVGTAGKNLDALLAMADIRREEIYITNAVKYRPARPGKRAGTFTNRPPAAKEIARCRDYLLKELSVVQPETPNSEAAESISARHFIIPAFFIAFYLMPFCLML